ncbi:hypothetical protein ACFPTY_19935 [Halomonas beimenensis]|uniref:hypothetical protein n=1 Tax=Halomonas beimenensis TaxID=475662 RepID=UPI00360C7304
MPTRLQRNRTNVDVRDTLEKRVLLEILLITGYGNKITPPMLLFATRTESSKTFCHKMGVSITMQLSNRVLAVDRKQPENPDTAQTLDQIDTSHPALL